MRRKKSRRVKGRGGKCTLKDMVKVEGKICGRERDASGGKIRQRIENKDHVFASLCLFTSIYSTLKKKYVMFSAPLSALPAMPNVFFSFFSR